MPGDRVLIRGGIYPLASRAENVLSRSGTATQPIVFEGYGSEDVIIRGVGFEDRDLNGDGYADGPADTGTRSALIRITGSHVQVRKVEVERAPYVGLSIEGTAAVVEEVRVQDCWQSCVVVTGNRNVLRYVEMRNARHGSGLQIYSSTRRPAPTDNQVVRSLSYDNGRDATGQQVLRIPGDPAGGGNSDGMGTFKACHDSFPTNVCTKELFQENIVWRNIDDGYDVSMANSIMVGNVAIDNGPTGRRGIKVLRGDSGNLFAGNLSIASQYRGLELRGMDTMDVFHNLAIASGDKGGGGVTNGTGAGRYYNNLGYLNGGNVDFLWSGGEATHNWVRSQGNPFLVNAAASIDLALPPGTVAQRWRYVMQQVVAAYTPGPGSPLIDAGRLVPGFHCATADDDRSSPMSPNAPCRHWAGRAPDIGPFEFGLLGSPGPHAETCGGTCPDGRPGQR
jgi:hypothetical protein